MKNFKKTYILIIMTLLFSLKQVASETYTADTPMAEINGELITLGHVIAAVARLPKEYNNLESDYLLEGILEQMVNQELMAQTFDVSKIINKVTLENEIRSLKAKYAIEEQLSDFPTTEMVQSAYDNAISSSKDSEEFNASHILVDNEKLALDIIELLETGVDFSKLAQKESTGPSGPNGGQLGWFGLGQMVPEFEAAVVVLEIGKVSQPVKTQFGWHVIKLNDRRIKSTPKMDELQPEIIQKLSQDRIDELIKITSGKANIQLFYKDLDPSSIRDLNLLKN